jgi:hypothetical protein
MLAIGRCSAAVALATLCSFPRAAVARQGPVASALAQGHLYRHGVVPLRGNRAAAPVRSAGGGNLGGGNLSYQGGMGGLGVVAGTPHVYLVFWGSQWGSQGTNSQGDLTLSGDPMAIAPALQRFMKGLGTGGETWSGVMTQYCQGVS